MDCRTRQLVSDRLFIAFEERPGIVAQLEERLLHTQEVIGSRPVDPIESARIKPRHSPGLFYFRAWLPLVATGNQSAATAEVIGVSEGRRLTARRSGVRIHFP